jgi:hypothetical protein
LTVSHSLLENLTSSRGLSIRFQRDRVGDRSFANAVDTMQSKLASEVYVTTPAGQKIAIERALSDTEGRGQTISGAATKDVVVPS